MAVSRAPAGVVVAAAAARAAKLSYGLMGPPGLSDVRPLVAAWWDREAARPTGQQPFSSDRTIAWRSPRATQRPPWHRHRPPGMEEGKLTGGSTSMFKIPSVWLRAGCFSPSPVRAQFVGSPHRSGGAAERTRLYNYLTGDERGGRGPVHLPCRGRGTNTRQVLGHLGSNPRGFASVTCHSRASVRGKPRLPRLQAGDVKCDWSPRVWVELSRFGSPESRFFVID
jgi:hypothetical protein